MMRIFLFSYLFLNWAYIKLQRVFQRRSMRIYRYSYVPQHVRWGDGDRETVIFRALSDLIAAKFVLDFQKGCSKNISFTKEDLRAGTVVKRAGLNVFREKRWVAELATLMIVARNQKSRKISKEP